MATQWNNTQGGDWTVGGNWSAGVPNGSSDATIGVGGFYTVTLMNASGQAASLTIDNPNAILSVRAPNNTAPSSLAISGNVDNDGALILDNIAGNADGGSSLTIGGTLINAGLVNLGNPSLSKSTTASAAALVNTGTLNVFGDGTLNTTHQTIFTVAAAAPTVVSASISVEGDADLVFGSGGIQTITSTGFLQLIGAQSRISIGAGLTSTALTGLSSNAGTFSLRGNINPVGFQGGEGGAVVTTTTDFNNTGTLNVDAIAGNADGSSTLTIGGTLTNAGTANFGNISLSGQTTINAAGLVNTGTLNVFGNGLLNATNQTTFNVTGAAPSVVTNYISVDGDADLVFGSGGIQTIGSTGFLQLIGAQSRISIGAGLTSTALSGLSSNAGTFSLRGNVNPVGSGGGEGGAVVTTTTDFNNTGTLNVDAITGNADGGSSLAIGGTLINSGTVTIGNANMTAPTTVTAAALNDTGPLTLQGNGSANTTNQATLAIAGAAPATLNASWFVGGDADLEFGSGISQIGAAGSLVMVGSGARISLGADTTSTALLGLSGNAGLLQLRGNLSQDSGGASVTTTTDFANSGTLYVDVITGNADGGSSLTIGGTLTNTGTVTIGNAAMTAPTTVTAAALNDSGPLILQGNGSANTTNQATLAIAGAAPTTLNASWFVGGDADLEFGTGISQIGAAGSLVMVGSGARISLGADTTSTALLGLSGNAGFLQLRGNLSQESGGASVTTTTDFANSGTLDVDVVTGNADGGSSLTIGGTLTNTGTVSIGNSSMVAPTTVRAAAYDGTGSLALQGGGDPATAKQATLAIAGAAPATLNASWFVGGDADLEFGGGISQIGAAGSLVMVGSGARISLGADTTSTALLGLSGNAGFFQLRGNIGPGRGGASVTTTTDFANSGTLDVDVVTGNADGGSNLTIGGTLTNTGTVTIGNAAMTAATTVMAAALNDTGPLTLQGNGSANTTNQATLAIAGAAPTTLNASWFVGGDADLEFGSGISQIGAAGSLVMVGSGARISLGADTTSTALLGLSGNAGLLQLRGNLSQDSGGASITTTTDFANSGTLDVDVITGNADGGSSMTIGGTLTNTGTVTIGNAAMTAPTTVTATGLVNSGTLSVQGGGKNQAVLQINGNGSDSGTISVNGNAALSAASLFIANGGSLLVGSGASVSGIVAGSAGRETVQSGGTAIAPIISGGTLDLAGGGVSGSITFGSSSGGLVIEQSASPLGTIVNFTGGNTVDLRFLAFSSSGTATLGANNVLQISENGGSFALDFDPGQNFAGKTFTLSADSSGGTLVSLQQPPQQSQAILDNFGWAQGWGSPDNPRLTADVDGNGTTDYLGFGASTTFIAYGGTFSDGQGHTGPGFTPAVAAVNDFGTNEGYTSAVQRGAAMTGSGVGASIYGQGFSGIYWYGATGATPQTDATGKTYDVLQYQSTPNLYGNFGSQEGWTPANGFQVVKASTADSFASILGFGNDGIVVGPQAFAPNATAVDSYTIPLAVGNNAGWNQQVDVRTFTDANGNALDLNHDGITDFVGMGPQGLVYAFGSETGGTYGLGPLTTANIGANGGGPDLGEAQGWNDATTLRDIVRDPKTGFDDILAFGAAGVYVAMGQDPTRMAARRSASFIWRCPISGRTRAGRCRRRRASSATSTATASPTSLASAPTARSPRWDHAMPATTCTSLSTRARRSTISAITKPGAAPTRKQSARSAMSPAPAVPT